ncbi:MAG TPA: sigma-E factor regulatory protein RseB domain-containing protein [Spirillospora sp.]
MIARALTGRGRRRCALACGLACGLAGAIALAAALTGGEPAASTRNVRSDPGAVALLRGAASAASRVPYHGRRFLTTAGPGRSATSRTSVSHTPGGGVLYRSETAGKSYRSETAAQEAAVFTPETLALLTRNYSVVRVADSTACGRPARVVEARRADGSTAGRFLIDAETGLMLHRELIDATGRAVVSSGFSEISFTVPSDEPATFDGPRKGLARLRGDDPAGREATGPWDDELDRAELDELRGRGWPVPEDLPGRLTLHDARRDPGGTVHLSYSDGLAAVSVFVQPGTLDERAMAGWQKTVRGDREVFRAGTVRHWAVSQGDGYVVTVLTDAPQSTAEAVAVHLSGRADPFWARLSRGARRIASAANPFG